MDHMTCALTSDQQKSYLDNGFLIVRGLLRSEEIDALRDTFMEQSADGPVEGLSDNHARFDATDPLAYYPRMMHPHRHQDKPVGPISMRTMLDARLEAILAQLFGEEPVAAQSMFYFKPPGARGQDLHQDNFYLRVSPGTCIAAWVAIDDADPENGGLVVVPSSDRCDIVCPERADASVSFTMDHVDVPSGMHEEAVHLKRGDVLFFNGSLIHGSYPNTSRERFRRAFICHYVARSSAEVAGGYRPLLTFEGEEVEMADATEGGPCGTPYLSASPH